MVESKTSSEIVTTVEMQILRITCDKCNVSAFNLTNAGADLFLSRHSHHASDLLYLARITSPPEFAGKELWMQLKGK